MISQQIRTWGINDEKTLNAFIDIPRDEFVPNEYKNVAYSEVNIPLENDEVMLSPMIEAKILSELNIKPSDKVLEIGTGTGFLTALLAKQAQEVTSIDIHSDFIKKAKYKLKSKGIYNTRLITADGSKGFSKHGPFDVVVITGSMPELPQTFFDHLNIKGRLFAFLGNIHLPMMEATIFEKESDDKITQKSLFETNIPPLKNIEQPEIFTF